MKKKILTFVIVFIILAAVAYGVFLVVTKKEILESAKKSCKKYIRKQLRKLT